MFDNNYVSRSSTPAPTISPGPPGVGFALVPRPADVEMNDEHTINGIEDGTIAPVPVVEDEGADGTVGSTVAGAAGAVATAIARRMRDSQLSDVFQLLRTPLCFMIFVLILDITSMVVLITANSPSIPTFVDEYTQWGNCVLNNYDGTDNSWVPSCGYYPQFRVSMQYRILLILTTTGQAIFVSIIAAPSTIGVIYRLHREYKRTYG